MSEELLSHRVYDWLMQRLLSRELKPGDRLNRRQVAEQVGVSVAPALEAMLQLEGEGFLETIPRQGTRVRQIDPVEVRGQLYLREAIEVQAARLYCGQAVIENEPNLLKLADVVDASDPYVEENWQAEIKFHRALMELAQCPVLLNAFDHVMRHSLFYSVNQVLPPPRVKSIPDRHHQLVRHLQTEDPDEADRVMREHHRARIEKAVRQTEQVGA